jgi:hypothetical protein
MTSRACQPPEWGQVTLAGGVLHRCLDLDREVGGAGGVDRCPQALIAVEVE